MQDVVVIDPAMLDDGSNMYCSHAEKGICQPAMQGFGQSFQCFDGRKDLGYGNPKPSDLMATHIDFCPAQADDECREQVQCTMPDARPDPLYPGDCIWQGWR